MKTARQINGDIKCDEKAISRSRHRYERVVAMDDSQQINGNISGWKALELVFLKGGKGLKEKNIRD